ncbi:MAG: gluconate 2-dehydrogenase subunit 3 family protein [Myxococcaceae bacterium]|nr:gluconate 2-dehydrogenase subunit 3 family protein [Myxococcaceae bacterium]
MPSTPSRREVLAWVSGAAAASALPACAPSSAPVPPVVFPRFLTDAERGALGALVDAVLPPDDLPGASALGVVEFIDRLLTALEPDGAPLFAGGPYSGRAPYPAPDGSPSRVFPANDFLQGLGLDRVQAKAWRLYLYGSDGTPGGGPNDALLGKTVGLRDRLRGLLGAALQKAPALATADDAGRAAAFKALSQEDRQLLIELTCDGAFSAPEYGGNLRGAGWALAGYEGDTLPLGFTQYDAVKGALTERAEFPMSKPESGADPRPLDSETRAVIAQLAMLAGGQEFK